MRLGYDNCSMESNGEAMVMRHILPYCKVAFDAGANVGGWSDYAFKTNKDLIVYAFEPVPHIFSLLASNVNLTAFNFNPYKLGLSDTDSQKTFYMYAKNNSTVRLSSFYRREDAIEKRLGLIPTEVNITTERLDSFCEKQGISHIDFLKIDTEGSELDVIKGAAGMLQNQSIDVIQFEYGGCYLSAHIKLQDVFTLLTGCGYKVFRILPDKLVSVSEWRTELENYKYSNLLAISSSVLDK